MNKKMVKSERILSEKLLEEISELSISSKLILPDNKRIQTIYILSILHAIKKEKDIITVTEIRNLYRKTQYYSPYEEYKRKVVRDLAEHQPPLIKKIRGEHFLIKTYFMKDGEAIEGDSNLQDLTEEYQKLLKDILVNELDVEDVEGVTTFLRVIL